MWLRYNYRLYPATRQQIALARAFGCARVVYNDALAAREAAHEAGEPYPTDAQLSARLTAIKATPERAWLTEVSAVVLQQALADLNTAYRNYFASRTGTRKGPKTDKPRFRSRKNNRQTIRFTANARFKVLPNGKLRLPKIGDVPVRWSRPLPSAPSSATVIRDSAGRYFASFVIEARGPRLPKWWASISASTTSLSCRTGERSPHRSSCAVRRKGSSAASASCRASRRVRPTNTKPE